MIKPATRFPTPPALAEVTAALPRARATRNLPAAAGMPGTQPAEVPAKASPAYRIASRPAELYSAFALVYDRYVRAGLMEPNPYRMRVTPYHLLPTTEVYVAVQEREVVCTLSLVGDGKLGLPLETIYSREVGWRRRQGLWLGEVSCLADKRQGRKRSLPVVLKLMSLMAQCAGRRGIDQLMIAVHPRHARFYQHFAAFEPVGQEKTYQAVCGNPAVALVLDLNRAPIDHPRLYDKFFGTPFPDEAVMYHPIPGEVRSELSFIVNETWVHKDEPELDLLACA